MSRLTEPSVIVGLLIATATGSLATWYLTKTSPPAPVQRPMISLEKLGHLASVRVNYSDIIEFSAKRAVGSPFSNWELRLGATKILLVAKGDCTIATNLSAASYGRADQQTKTVEILLPPPQPLQARINHDGRDKGGSYFFAITDTGVEVLVPNSAKREKAVNDALKIAQASVERTCSQPQVVQTAKTNAEQVLRPMFQAIGWNPTFRWGPQLAH